ncbi:MAG: M28 family peptidase [Pseudomonadota bacterium]
MEIIVKLIILPVLILATLLSCGGKNTHFAHPDPDISIDNLKQTVQYLSSMSPARSFSYPESLENSAQYISQKFIEYGLEPKSQKFEVSGYVYENIIASAGPKEGERIIVGAHFDVCGDQPGADDNASAVAGLLEIARFAKKHESKLPYRVDFVAYNLEEPPFFGTENMGSYFHAKSLHDNNIKIRGMICLEMIGFFSDKEKSQTYPVGLMRLFYPGTGDFICVVSNYGSSSLAKQLSLHLKATSVNVETLKAPSIITGVDFSDHRNYWHFGYDAVMITDTAFYRNPNYHQTSDTIDTLDFTRMKEVVKGVCWSLLNIK